jgi:Electron transfer flavoprotein, beta subunit
MKIAVCVKQVPDSWAEKKMVNGVLDRENVDAVLNDLDEYAVEEALRIAEAHGGNEEGGPHYSYRHFNGTRACNRGGSQSFINGCQ